MQEIAEKRALLIRNSGARRVNMLHDISSWASLSVILPWRLIKPEGGAAAGQAQEGGTGV